MLIESMVYQHHPYRILPKHSVDIRFDLVTLVALKWG